MAMAFRDLRFLSNRGERKILSRSVYQRQSADSLVHRWDQALTLLSRGRRPMQNPFSFFLSQFLETERVRLRKDILPSGFSRLFHEQLFPDLPPPTRSAQRM
jgi:hypothetical protein